MAQPIDLFGATFTVSKAGFTNGTTTTLTTGAAVTYAIKGKAYTVSAITNGAAPTVDAVTGEPFKPINPGYGSVFTIGFNASGTLQVIQGEINALDSHNAFESAPEFGPLPDNFAPFAYQVVRVNHAASAAWTFGVNNQSGVTNVQYARQDVLTLPDRPQVS